MLTQETPTTQRLRRPPYFVYHTTRVIFHDGAKPWRHHLLRRTPFSQTSVPQQIARYELCVPALGPAAAAAVAAARVAVAARAQQPVTRFAVLSRPPQPLPAPASYELGPADDGGAAGG